jgi:hypothetical protein
MSDTTDRMQDCARTIETILPPHTGFVLLAFDLGPKTGRLEYVSNGRRADVIKAMMEFINKAGPEQNWGKNV